MSKKKITKLKPQSHERKIKRNNDKETKSQRANKGQYRTTSGANRQTLPKTKTKAHKLTKAQKKNLSLVAKKRLRDDKGHFISNQFTSKIKNTYKEVKEKILSEIGDIEGLSPIQVARKIAKKRKEMGLPLEKGRASKMPTNKEIQRAIENKTILEKVESNTVDYFRVLSRIMENIKDSENGFLIAVSPYGSGFKKFNAIYKEVKAENNKRKDFSRMMIINPDLADIIESQKTLIDDAATEYEKRYLGKDRKGKQKIIRSKLFKIPETLYADMITGDLYSLEYDYNKLETGGTGVSKQKFLDIMYELIN